MKFKWPFDFSQMILWKKKKSWKHFVQTKNHQSPLTVGTDCQKKSHLWIWTHLFLSKRHTFSRFHSNDKTKKILSSNHNPNKSKNPNNNPNLFHASIVKNYTKSRTLNPKRRLSRLFDRSHNCSWLEAVLCPQIQS